MLAWGLGWGGGLLERILLRTNPMLGILSIAAGGVLVLNRLRGMTIVELPLLLDLRLRLPADAPRENAGEA